MKNLKEHLKQRQEKSNYGKLDNIILNDDFYKEINLEKFEVSVILKELHDSGYIYDVASTEPKFTDVHTCKITDKGLDALKNYVEEKENCEEDGKQRNKIIEKILDLVSRVIKIVEKILGLYLIVLIVENL